MPTINPTTTLQPTALVLMQSIQEELGLTATTSITANDKTVKQLLRLMNAAGKELAKLYDWTWITRTQTITFVNAQDTYNRPTGWLRELSDTTFNTTQKWPLRSPVSEQEWAWLQAGYGLSPPYYRARPVAGGLELFPTPADNTTQVQYAYISGFWNLGYDGANNTVDKATITLDNDIPVYDERMFITFVKVKFFAVKGFDTTVLAQEFDAALEYAKGQDRGARTYDLLNGYEDAVLLGPNNFPNSIPSP